jgi:hypothetical protein
MASGVKPDGNDARTNYARKNECLKMIKVLNHKYLIILNNCFLNQIEAKSLLFSYRFSFKNLEKEQKSHILNRKNEKEYATIYEMHITNDMNIKNESKD